MDDKGGASLLLGYADYCREVTSVHKLRQSLSGHYCMNADVMDSSSRHYMYCYQIIIEELCHNADIIMILSLCI